MVGLSARFEAALWSLLTLSWLAHVLWYGDARRCEWSGSVVSCYPSVWIALYRALARPTLALLALRALACAEPLERWQQVRRLILLLAFAGGEENVVVVQQKWPLGALLFAWAAEEALRAWSAVVRVEDGPDEKRADGRGRRRVRRRASFREWIAWLHGSTFIVLAPMQLLLELFVVRQGLPALRAAVEAARDAVQEAAYERAYDEGMGGAIAEQASLPLRVRVMQPVELPNAWNVAFNAADALLACEVAHCLLLAPQLYALKMQRRARLEPVWAVPARERRRRQRAEARREEKRAREYREALKRELEPPPRRKKHRD
jgi:hypothetical protein